jgi:hypothetical protein
MKPLSDKQRRRCQQYLNSKPPPKPWADLDRVNHLQPVADTFFQAQQQRHTADYDHSKTWTRTEVLTRIAIVDSAFKS